MADERRYEYQVVQMKTDLKRKSTPAEQFAEQVNLVAAYGWRLVTVVDHGWAYFERPVKS